MANISLETSMKKLNRLKFNQAKNILKLYKNAISKIDFNDLKSNRELLELKNSILENYKILNKQLERAIMLNMKYVSTTIVNDLNKAIGLDSKLIQELFAYVPADVVNNLVTGKVYANGWTLSKTIWGQYNIIEKDLGSIIAQGIAENAPTLQIAQAIERYVTPGAKKPWEWSKVYPQSNKIIDYNAQRLARTLVQHAYQQSFEMAIKDNPYINKVKWHSALSHGRTCEICRERNGKIYKKGHIPLDHPNGLCTLIAVTDKTLMDISNELADWANGTTSKGVNKKLNSWGYKLIRQGKIQGVDINYLKKNLGL